MNLFALSLRVKSTRVIRVDFTVGLRLPCSMRPSARAIMVAHPENLWGVTVEFTTKFKKPIPLDKELRVIGRITGESSRFFEGTGEILLPDGEIGATGIGKYIKLPLEKIADFNAEEQEWKVTPKDNDPKTIDLSD
jgi:hypothetical protein